MYFFIGRLNIEKKCVKTRQLRHHRSATADCKYGEAIEEKNSNPNDVRSARNGKAKTEITNKMMNIQFSKPDKNYNNSTMHYLFGPGSFDEVRVHNLRPSLLTLYIRSISEMGRYRVPVLPVSFDKLFQLSILKKKIKLYTSSS